MRISLRVRSFGIVNMALVSSYNLPRAQVSFMPLSRTVTTSYLELKEPSLRQTDRPNLFPESCYPFVY